MSMLKYINDIMKENEKLKEENKKLKETIELIKDSDVLCEDNIMDSGEADQNYEEFIRITEGRLIGSLAV